MTTSAKGRWGEDIAVKYLTSFNWGILARNWRCNIGELDIICIDPCEINTVVFVEVKLRATNLFGEPYEAVTKHKAYKLVKAIRLFMLQPIYSGYDWRLDVISINVSDNKIRHFRNISGYSQR